MKRLTFFSLFSGCGGSSTGYKLAGFKPLLAVDWSKKAPKFALDTYRLNHKKTELIDDDITKVSADLCMELTGVKKRELDLLDGSPPYQGFSTCNTNNRAVDNEKNKLVNEMIRLTDELQPKVFVMENVEGFIKHPMQDNAKRVIRQFEACGYSIRVSTLNARNYGVAQSRPRLFIIGIRKDLGIIPTFPTRNKTLIPCGQLLRYDGKLLSDDRIDTMRKSSFFSGKFVDLSLPFPTIAKSYGQGGETPIIKIGREFYLLSVEEAKLISSFPKNYEFVGNWYQSIQQIGNCVPPLLTYAVAKNIRKLVFHKAATDRGNPSIDKAA